MKKSFKWYLIWFLAVVGTDLFIMLGLNEANNLNLWLGLMFLQISYILYVKYYHLATIEQRGE